MTTEPTWKSAPKETLDRLTYQVEKFHRASGGAHYTIFVFLDGAIIHSHEGDDYDGATNAALNAAIEKVEVE